MCVRVTFLVCVWQFISCTNYFLSLSLPSLFFNLTYTDLSHIILSISHLRPILKLRMVLPLWWGAVILYISVSSFQFCFPFSIDSLFVSPAVGLLNIITFLPIFCPLSLLDANPTISPVLNMTILLDLCWETED